MLTEAIVHALLKSPSNAPWAFSHTGISRKDVTRKASF